MCVLDYSKGTMYSVIPLTVLLAVLIISQGSWAENCTSPFHGELLTSGLNPLDKDDTRGVQVLVPGITFGCKGQITKWEMMILMINTQPHIMHYQIWRPLEMGRFEMIASIPIDTPLGKSNECVPSEVSISSNPVLVEPGDVFGFFMPRTEGGGSLPSFQQCYSTDPKDDPSSTLYYMNVDGLYPPCVLSLCDPAMNIRTGVQLQVNVSIVADTMSHSDDTIPLCSNPEDLPAGCVPTSSVGTPTPFFLPTAPPCEDEECAASNIIVISTTVAGVVILLLVVLCMSIVTMILCKICGRCKCRKKGQAVYDTVVHYCSENGSMYAIPRNKSNSGLQNNLQGDTLQSETPDGLGPITMTALSSTDSLAVPYSDPVRTGIVAISNHSINTADKVHSVSVTVINRDHPTMPASSSSPVPYMDPVPVTRRATLPSRPSHFRSFQHRELSSATSHSIPSMVTSAAEFSPSCGGMSVPAKQEVMPYAFSSVATLNTLREESSDTPAMYLEPTSTAHDHGQPAAAFPYSEPSRLMLDRIPADNSTGTAYTEPKSCSSKIEHDQTEVPLPYQDPISTVPSNRHVAKQQSMEQLPNPYMEPSPTSGLRRQLGTQADQNSAIDLFPNFSSTKAFDSRKNLQRGFKLHKQHSLDYPNPYMDPTPSFTTRRMHSVCESKAPAITSSFVYIPPEELSRMRANSVEEEHVFHVPRFELRKNLPEEEIYSKLLRSKAPGFFEQKDTFWEPQNSAAELYNQLAEHKYREIHRRHIGISNCIGSGHFGTVHKGVWQFSGRKLEVAVKTLRPNVPEKEKVSFLREAAIMGQFLHPNVIKLHGVVTVGEPLMIILELMPKGDLKCFVKSQKQRLPDLNHLELARLFVNFCRDIACGMNYLAKKEFVHRDLAARNVLLTDDLTCKIGDFGMARDVSNDDIYESKGGMIPLKWTAPEAVNYGQFSSDSDVWSYGMVLYEMWSLGHKPFEGMHNEKILSLISSGHCQPPPPGCPRNVYKLMMQCWHPEPKSRPTFSQVVDYLNVADEALLEWNNQDEEVSNMATELGSPLSEGLHLYPDLQNFYKVSSPN